MHPDPKRQGQLQVRISRRGNDIGHLKKHTQTSETLAALSTSFIQKEKKTETKRDGNVSTGNSGNKWREVGKSC